MGAGSTGASLATGGDADIDSARKSTREGLRRDTREMLGKEVGLDVRWAMMGAVDMGNGTAWEKAMEEECMLVNVDVMAAFLMALSTQLCAGPRWLSEAT